MEEPILFSFLCDSRTSSVRTCSSPSFTRGVLGQLLIANLGVADSFEMRLCFG